MGVVRRQRVIRQHLVEGALEAGTLKQVRGVWQLRGRTAVTSELASLLDGRVDQLPDNVLHTLRLLTFCEPLDLDTLSGIAGVEAVEDAENRGLIRVGEEHNRIDVRFNHPLFGEVIRRRLGMAAARRLRGEVVRASRAPVRAGPADPVGGVDPRQRSGSPTSTCWWPPPGMRSR